MKYVMILPDGAADEPLPQLDGRTPLEAANTPHIDWIAQNGRQGRVVTVPEGFNPGSDVATLSLLGYDVRTDYFGRAPLEAAGRGITIEPGEIVFRCNFVTVLDDVMVDFTAGHISQCEADRLIADLGAPLEQLGWRLHGGVSYRNLAVTAGMADAAPICTPPHDIPDQPVKPHRPRGTGSDLVNDVMDRARAILEDHEINQVRRDLGENPATDIWLWGSGRPRPLASLTERYRVSGVAIAAVDLIRGIARCAGLDLVDVPGATGYLDTNYAAKGSAAVEALKRYDFVVVHVEAPDEAGHLGDATAKVEAIEQIDQNIVGPLLRKLRKKEGWKILIAPDHPTPVARRVHSAEPPPFCMAGDGVTALLKQPFSEATASRSDLFVDPGHELIEFFFRT